MGKSKARVGRAKGKVRKRAPLLRAAARGAPRRTLMMPPKMLTRMALTLGSLVRILSAVLTCSDVAPPPTSRKFAGLPPCSLIMSMVAMASPAPFTMQPMEPSRPT